MLSIEHERSEVVDKLLSMKVDLLKKESRVGNTAMHLACKKGDVDSAKKLFLMNQKLCLVMNYEGNTPFHLAVQAKSVAVLDIFIDYKVQSLSLKNANGENPLFIAARVGDFDVFNWFSGQIDFFKARGERNYLGQTIEHVVCMLT
jgi:ankyrin repeat protein